MSHINVTINGRQYRMACEEGQEVRLLKLAESLESRIELLRGKFGEIGDARLTVMAALTVCDEERSGSAAGAGTAISLIFPVLSLPGIHAVYNTGRRGGSSIRPVKKRSTYTYFSV